MTHSIVPPSSAPSPVSPAPWLVRQGFRRLDPGSLQPGELEPLGFCASSEAAALLGGWLLPVLWHNGQRVALGSHRLRLDSGAQDEPRRGPRRPVLAALGALRTDPGAWSALPAPLVLVEGDRAAAWLAAVLPAALVIGCPAPTSPEAPAPLEPWGRRALGDARRLALRGRRVVLVARAEGPLSPDLATLARGLEAQGAKVQRAGAPPPGSFQHDPDPALGPALEAWLAAPPAPRAAATPCADAPGVRLREALPEAFWSGPEDLTLPEPYRLLDEPGSPLVLERKGRLKLVAHEALWPVGQVNDPPAHLLLSAVVKDEHRFVLRSVLLSRRVLYDPRELCGQLADYGVNLPPDGQDRIAPYLSTFLRKNALPLRVVQTSSGWDHEKKVFYYGEEPIGGEGSMVGLVHDESTRQLFRALGKKGDGLVWKAAAEAMMDAAPAAALVLAAAIASPMLRLFGWPSMGLLFGALGGAGKSSMLRLGASAFGSGGESGAHQPQGLVGKADGSFRGLILQFRRFSDFPHLADELKPKSTDERQREEMASVLHQIFEGQEYVRATRASNGTIVGKPFAGCTVVGGEVAASDFLRKGGVIRRFLPPPAPFTPAGMHLGVFTAALEKNHGHLGRALVEGLVATSAATREEMATRHALYLEPLGITPEHPEHLRTWSGQIATALAAVDVCAQLCPALCPHPTRWKLGIHEAWRQILDADTQGQSSDLVTQVEEKIRSWVARHRYHLQASRALRQKLELRGQLSDQERLLLVPREPAIGQVFEAEREGEEDELLLKVDVFQTALTKFLAAEGYSEGTLTRALADRGLLEPTAGQGSRGAVGRPVRMNGTVVKVYRVVLAAQAAPPSQRVA